MVVLIIASFTRKALYTVLDGVVALDMRLIGSRLERDIQILKLRGRVLSQKSILI
jgi:hypothetical protein